MGEKQERRASDTDLGTRNGALLRIYECMEDYLDDHKERAFKSAFIEPARFYFHSVRDSFGRDHVNVHGLNWYLALVHATLGVQVPHLPDYDDIHTMGICDFWAGLTDECWEHFSCPASFGSDFEGIEGLRCRQARSFIRRRVNSEQLPHGTKTLLPRILGNIAVDPAAVQMRQALAVYPERFAHFFSRNFFCAEVF